MNKAWYDGNSYSKELGEKISVNLEDLNLKN